MFVFLASGDFGELRRLIGSTNQMAKGALIREASAPMAREAVSMFREVVRIPISAVVRRDSFEVTLELPERPRRRRQKKGEVVAPLPRRGPRTATSFLPRNWGERLAKAFLRRKSGV
jgi:hypothetical protein